MGNIYFSSRDSILRTDQSMSFTSILKYIIDNLYRDSMIVEVLIDLKQQSWIIGKLKTDAESEPDMWGFGVFHIFNIIPKINFPATIVDWYIFKENWYDKVVRTKAIYTDDKGTCKIAWYGV